VYIVMGKTDPEAPKHAQQSMVVVPANTPGVKVVRPVKKGQSLCWDDVAMDTTTHAYQLRREMEAGYSF
jgi:alkylation response protein AidB-like acyl-CoA dehydrogenase